MLKVFDVKSTLIYKSCQTFLQSAANILQSRHAEALKAEKCVLSRETSHLVALYTSEAFRADKADKTWGMLMNLPCERRRPAWEEVLGFPAFLEKPAARIHEYWVTAVIKPAKSKTVIQSALRNRSAALQSRSLIQMWSSGLLCTNICTHCVFKADRCSPGILCIILSPETEFWCHLNHAPPGFFSSYVRKCVFF